MGKLKDISTVVIGITAFTAFFVAVAWISSGGLRPDKSLPDSVQHSPRGWRTLDTIFYKDSIYIVTTKIDKVLLDTIPDDPPDPDYGEP